MGRLTTHILDTANGCPAEGVQIDLVAFDGLDERPVRSVRTNADGRSDAPVAEGDELPAGVYELRFHVGDYLRATFADLPSPAFLDVVPIRFGVSADEHYHVPLLISPYGYSTYRGS